MNIFPNIDIVDLALYTHSTLIIADVHIGYEESLNKQGILIPRLQFDDIISRMSKIFETLKGKKIEKVVVNGDLKHEFGTISEQEWRNTIKFLDLLSKHCDEIILIKGNHDTILGPIAKKRNVKILDYYLVEPICNNTSNEDAVIKKYIKKLKNNKTLIIHGNKIPGKKLLKDASTIIIGHEHPAVSIKEGPRVEQYKCFLKGKYNSKDLIVQPSFNSIVPGTDMLKNQVLSPFLKQNLDNFEAYVVEDKIYKFGKLKNLHRN